MKSNAGLSLSDDEWSYVMKFLCTSNAWESATTIARMQQTCSMFNGLRLWPYWSSTFHIMPFGNRFPKILVSFMISAAARGGFVNQHEAMDHLKISASWLEGVCHKTTRLRRKRVMYLYKIEDVLQVATTKYGCLQAMEEHIFKCEQRKRAMERNKKLRQERRQEVEKLLAGIGASFMLRRTYSEIEAYVHNGKGSLESIRVMAMEKKKIHDQAEAIALAKSKREQQVRSWASSFGLEWALALRIPEVTQYMNNGTLSKALVIEACSQESDRLEERRQVSAQQAPLRRSELKVELEAHGLNLRRDSRFCQDYITGETNASLQEVVATMKITSFLFARGYLTWSKWHSEFEREMRRMMTTGQCGNWYDACNRTIELFGGNNFDDESSDDDFY